MEKKWFVRVGGQQKGPTSLEEAKSLVSSDPASESYAWTEGMAQWQRTSEIAEFKPTQGGPPSNSSVPVRPDEISTFLQVGKEQIEEPTAVINSKDRKQVKKEVARAQQLATQAEKKEIVRPWKKIFAVLGGVIVLGAAVFFQFRDSLEEIIFIFPEIQDVSPEDYLELRRAARTKVSAEGQSLALAISSVKGSEPPSIYVSANRPNGTELEGTLRSLPYSVLEGGSVSLEFSIVLNKRLGKSAPLITKNGSPIPSAQYMIKVKDKSDPKMALEKKLLFLGGMSPGDYGSRLGKYRDQMKEQISSELKDLKSLYPAIIGYVDFSQKAFEQSLTIISPEKRKNAWTTYQKQLASDPSRLEEKFNPPANPNEAQKKKFYSAHYQKVREFWQMAKALQERQNAFFLKPPAPAAKEAAIKDIRDFYAQCHSQAEQLARDLAKTEESWKTSSGLPEREGG